DDLDMRDRLEPIDDCLETPGREHERIAAGEDHLPDLGMRADIVERGIELPSREPAFPTNDLAAEAEAAVRGADVHRLEQHAVGIAVDDARDRAVGRIADRIRPL